MVIPKGNNMNKLQYEYIAPGETPFDPTVFRIQPSALSRFFDYTNQFFREKLLGETGFISSTAACAGTCVHYLAEQYCNNGAITDDDRNEIYEYISLQASDDVDPDEVRTRIRPMWAVLKPYLDEHPSSLSEPLVSMPTAIAGIALGGSIDSLIDLTDPTAKYSSIDEVVASGHNFKIVDYKTTSTKSPIAKFAKGYKFQLLAYSLILKHLGVNVTEIELVYITQEHIGAISEKTGKQLKSYPSQVYTLTEPVTPESLEFIQSLVTIISHSVEAFVTKPELRGIIGQDARLIDNTQPLPFTSIGTTTELDI